MTVRTLTDHVLPPEPAETLIVTLAEVKSFLNVKDETHDAVLTVYCEAVGPLIENIVGPILVKTYDEWYEGGHVTIALRHKPSFGYGATPVLNLMAVSEYQGVIERNLGVVGNPAQGSIYSVMEHGELGIIARRSAGGGTVPFWRDPNHPQQSIHVIYQAGLETTPPGVKLAAYEAVKVAYENIMRIGRGFQPEDVVEPFPQYGGFLPPRALEFLEPYKRTPAFA